MSSNVINRRVFSARAVMAAAALGTPALWAQSAKLEKTRVAIAVGGKSSFHYLPLTLAEQLGYFKAEGLDVEISDFSAGERALQAAVGGAVDVVSAAYEHTITLQNRGQQFQAFVLQGRAPQIALGVSAKGLPHYKSVADLRGRKIGVTAPGSSTDMMAKVVLARAGLTAADVSLVGVGASAGALSALRSGQIDAICNIDPVMTMLEQKGDVRIVFDTRTLKGTREVFGGSMPAACLYAPLDFVQKNPNTAQALTNAIVHGLKWLQTAGPGDLINTVPESYLLGDRGLYLAAFEKMREAIALDGVFPEDGARTALRALSSFDSTLKADKIDLNKTWTNRFALRAKARFMA